MDGLMRILKYRQAEAVKLMIVVDTARNQVEEFNLTGLNEDQRSTLDRLDELLGEASCASGYLAQTLGGLDWPQGLAV